MCFSVFHAFRRDLETAWSFRIVSTASDFTESRLMLSLQGVHYQSGILIWRLEYWSTRPQYTILEQWCVVQRSSKHDSQNSHTDSSCRYSTSFITYSCIPKGNYSFNSVLTSLHSGNLNLWILFLQVLKWVRVLKTFL